MSSSLPVVASSDSRDPGVADSGRRRIDTAFQAMPVLQAIRKQFIKTQPLSGIRVVVGLGVTAESANLLVTLRDGGARVVGNDIPGRLVHEDVAAALSRDFGIEVHDPDASSPVEGLPEILLDAGACLVREWLMRRSPEDRSTIAATEDVAHGVPRLRALERQGKLRFPVVDLNESWTRSIIDRRHGVGQGTMDAITSVTGTLLAGVTLVVAGYGRCGRGIAMRARGLGALVIVTEVDPMRAAEALMDGFRVMGMGEAASLGNIICTVTGNRSVIGRDHFEKLKNGTLLVNAGNSEVEIDLETLNRLASNRRQTRDSLEEYTMRDGRRLRVLGAGKPLGQMPSPSVADTRFGSQALVLEYIIKNQAALGPRVYGVPEGIDRGVAKYKLEVMGIQIDRPTIEQEQYLANWSEGLL